jgi:hypothetical protein
MPEETERMRCRYCGNDDRASEGYPCQVCGTFICIICSIRGITTCRACEKNGGVRVPETSANSG